MCQEPRHSLLLQIFFATKAFVFVRFFSFVYILKTAFSLSIIMKNFSLILNYINIFQARTSLRQGFAQCLNAHQLVELATNIQVAR